MSFENLREHMVKTQLIPRGIKDKQVLSAMNKVPRHRFVDEHMQARAYDDMALSIGDGQTISQPYMVAIMTELLDLHGTENILEIGTGSGYQAAVLSQIAHEVYTVERIESLAKKAEARFQSLGYSNVFVKIDDGSLGWTEKAPFDRIIITAGTPEIPKPMLDQLSEGGIIIAPVGDRFSQQLLKVVKAKGRIIETRHTPCVFVPLIGQHGWSEDPDNPQFNR